jgi:hypothetical protein
LTATRSELILDADALSIGSDVLEARSFEIYNLLPDVETADGELSRRGRELLLETLGDVIRKHALGHCFGIRLLHRHNELDGDEIMVEAEEHDSAIGYSLTTIATASAYVTATIQPNGWQYHGGQYVPLEWSTDAEVTAVPEALARFPHFFADFAEALEREDVSFLLGPCVISRDFARVHRPSPGSIFIENCDVKRRANILRFEDPERYDPRKLIQTTWVVASSDNETDCNPACIPSGCNPVTACVVDTNGHTSQTAHVPGNHAAVHG